jgi:hypothetical protein
MGCVLLATIYIYDMRNGHSHNSTVLSDMLEPISRTLGLKTSRALAGLRSTARQQARAERLAEKCNEGRLTAAERSEYEAYVQASTLIGILQAKARRVIAQSKAA